MQITSDTERCLIEFKHDGRHWGVMVIQNFLNPSVPMSKIAAILKFFDPHLLPNISQIEPKLDGRHRGDIEIQNC